MFRDLLRTKALIDTSKFACMNTRFSLYDTSVVLYVTVAWPIVICVASLRRIQEGLPS